MRGFYQEVEEGQVGACSALCSGVLLFKSLQSFHCLITVSIHANTIRQNTNKTHYFNIYIFRIYWIFICNTMYHNINECKIMM